MHDHTQTHIHTQQVDLCFSTRARFRRICYLHIKVWYVSIAHVLVSASKDAKTTHLYLVTLYTQASKRFPSAKQSAAKLKSRASGHGRNCKAVLWHPRFKQNDCSKAHFLRLAFFQVNTWSTMGSTTCSRMLQGWAASLAWSKATPRTHHVSVSRSNTYLVVSGRDSLR